MIENDLYVYQILWLKCSKYYEQKQLLKLNEKQKIKNKIN